MRLDKHPVTIHVGAVLDIKAQALGDGRDYITVPRPNIVKLLVSGQVRVHHDYTYTDDYAWDAAVNFQTGDVTAEALLRSLESWGGSYLRANYRAPWVDVHGKTRPASIHCHRHLNEGYTILPLEGEITVEDR